MGLLFPLKDTNNKDLSIADVNAILLKFDAMDSVLKGGFGAATTAGVEDWNDPSNLAAGWCQTLLLGSAANGMGGSNYWYLLNLEYTSKNGTGNLTQIAFPYDVSSPTGRKIWMRSRFSGTWSSWYSVTFA